MESVIGREFESMVSHIFPVGTKQQAGKSKAGKNPDRGRMCNFKSCLLQCVRLRFKMLTIY